MTVYGSVDEQLNDDEQLSFLCLNTTSTLAEGYCTRHGRFVVRVRLSIVTKNMPRTL